MFCELCGGNKSYGERCLIGHSYHARLCMRHANEIDQVYCETDVWMDRLKNEAEYRELQARDGTDGYALAEEYLANDITRWKIAARTRAWAKAWLDAKAEATNIAAGQNATNRGK